VIISVFFYKIMFAGIPTHGFSLTVETAGILIHRQNSYLPRSRRCTSRREPANKGKNFPVQCTDWYANFDF
jgi:hypothetical protein